MDYCHPSARTSVERVKGVFSVQFFSWRKARNNSFDEKLNTENTSWSSICGHKVSTAKEHPMRKKSSKRNQPHPHPGSGSRGKLAPGDFGAPESDVIERTYTSENTKRADPGAAPPRSTFEGNRTGGAGGNYAGPGSSSGGDLDPDIIGFGKGDEIGGVAASGKIHDPPGPDDAAGTSRQST
jgi:hypothetical protein